MRYYSIYDRESQKLGLALAVHKDVSSEESLKLFVRCVPTPREIAYSEYAKCQSPSSARIFGSVDSFE